MVMAWSVDRLGRSLQDLVGFLSELHALKIDLLARRARHCQTVRRRSRHSAADQPPFRRHRKRGRGKLKR
jgi:hypothetical protein